MKLNLTSYIYYKAFYNFVEFDIKDLKRDWKNPHNITFDTYSNKDFKLLDDILNSIEKKFRPFRMDEVERRLNAGHMLFIAKKTEKIIGFFWAATKYGEISDFHALIHLDEQEAYDYNSYIVEEYRGKDINKGLKVYAFDVLRQKGFDRVVGYIINTNKSSLRSNEKIGYHIIGKTTLIRIMTLEYRYHNFYTKKIIFQGGALRLWKVLFGQLRNRYLISNPESAKTTVSQGHGVIKPLI